MSLANEEDIIIPNTVGIIKCLASDVNNMAEGLTEYLRGISNSYEIVSGRAKGTPLDKLVSKERIASGEANYNKRSNEESKVYENWFKEQ